MLRVRVYSMLCCLIIGQSGGTFFSDKTAFAVEALLCVQLQQGVSQHRRQAGDQHGLYECQTG